MPISGVRPKFRPSVLVADGNGGVCELFVTYLKHAGFDAVGTADGGEAVAALAKGPTAAVVLDLELAELDLAKLARVTTSGSCALVLTCRTFEHLRSFAHAELLLKPCLPSTVVGAVMRVLTRAARAGAR